MLNMFSRHRVVWAGLIDVVLELRVTAKCPSLCFACNAAQAPPSGELFRCKVK